MVGRTLEELPAEPLALARICNEANPALAGMSVQRWGRVKSHLRGALAEAGFEVMPGRDVKGLSPEWESLVAPLDRRYRYGLSRFFSFCSRQGVGPLDVDDGTFAAFHGALTASSLQANPEGIYRTSVNIWNEAAGKVAGWPKTLIARPPDARRSTIPIDAFPASLRDDIEACLKHSSTINPFSRDYSKPWSAATIRSRRKHLYQAARILVANGMPLDQIVGVSTLVDVTNAEAVLTHLFEAKGGTELVPSLGVLADTLRSVAQRWVKLPQADLQLLGEFVKNLTPKRTGKTVKNSTRLRQFAVAKNLYAILGLAARVLHSVERNPDGSNRQAVRVTKALAVEILTVAPMRMKNLTGLRLDQHIKFVGHGRQRRAFVVIPAEEMKTDTPFEAELPPDSLRLLTIYLKGYRGRIADGAGPYLFPGRGGERRADTTFSRDISKFIHGEA